MKFYKDKNNWYYWVKIKNNKQTIIYCDNYILIFFKNGKIHNYKNAAYIGLDGYKEFCLENEEYGDEEKFTKESWRKFVKLQAFL